MHKSNCFDTARLVAAMMVLVSRSLGSRSRTCSALKVLAALQLSYSFQYQDI